MKGALRRAIILGIWAAAAFTPAGLRAQTFNQAEKEAILDAHNQARCNVSPAAQTMPPLVWDADLEATAQAWVSQPLCVDLLAPIGLIDHNPNRSSGFPFYVGENIFAMSGGIAPAADAVVFWDAEKAHYTYATRTCAPLKVCGHYTQVVWANSRRVGCARSFCNNLNLPGMFPSSIVCNYGPGGNFSNEFPYVAGAGVNGACDLIFQDGFEFGSLSPWSLSSQTDGGDLAITAAAKLTPTGRGLQAVVDDTTSVYVADDTPTDESRYRARFYFDPNNFDPGQAQAHFRTRIFILFDAGPPTRRLAALVLKRQNGAFSLAARARLDDGSQADTVFFPITDAPHTIELDWQRSSTPSANNGQIHIWIDGVLRQSLTGLDNNLGSVDFVRMGALSVKGGAFGTMYFDELESRRQSYIGP